MKQRILELRNKGHSYNEIARLTGCSKSTISYHCGQGQKQKAIKRNREFKRKERVTWPFYSKLHAFLYKKSKGDTDGKNRTIRKNITYKLHTFRWTKNMPIEKITCEQIMEKIGDTPRCYLTGDILDLTKSKTYHFDHIIPASKGGQNTLDNLGIASKEANMSKAEMSPEEYFQLCKKVLEYNGYTVTKN